MSAALALLWLACSGAPEVAEGPDIGHARSDAAEEQGSGEDQTVSGVTSSGVAGASDEGASGQRQLGAQQDRAERLSASHILIGFTGSKAMLKVPRSRDDALALAGDVRARAVAGESFDDLAFEFTDDPGSRQRGGFLGSVTAGGWVAPFEQAVRGLTVGEISEPVESVYGFHIIQREALEEINLQHIVVQFQGNISVVKDSRPQRSREEARERAEAAARALEEGEDFAAVAARYSDGPMGPRGGDLGWFLRGELGPDFDEAAFALSPGEHSPISETRFGFQIIRRIE